MKSFIPWIGGKRLLVKRIVSLFPDNINRYIDVFGGGALFYCDPPYHKTEKYYDAEFSHDDHLRLKRCLNGIQGQFILSYNDDDFIRDLYHDFDIIPVERQNNLSKGTYKELIIKNF